VGDFSGSYGSTIKVGAMNMVNTDGKEDKLHETVNVFKRRVKV
jgi:hypothetical protein